MSGALPADREQSVQAADRIERAIARIEQAAARLDERHRALREAATAALHDLDRLIANANG